MTYVQGRKTFWVKDETATIRVLDSEVTLINLYCERPLKNLKIIFKLRSTNDRFILGIFFLN